jgi:hypothetical protein
MCVEHRQRRYRRPVRGATRSRHSPRVVKRPAFLEGVYRIEALGALDAEDERLAVLSVLMVLLLERQRG